MENNMNIKIENEEIESSSNDENINISVSAIKKFKSKLIKAYLLIGVVIHFTGNDISRMSDINTDIGEVLFAAVLDIVFWLPLTIVNLVNGVIQ